MAKSYTWAIFSDKYESHFRIRCRAKMDKIAKQQHPAEKTATKLTADITTLCPGPQSLRAVNPCCQVRVHMQNIADLKLCG